MELKIYNKEGAEVGTIALNEKLFGAEPKPSLVHQYIVNYLANQRQGTHSAKGRSEVSGGGSKPWRQKGTGRARAGTIRSPLWRGGGIVFGPQPRSYYSKFPKKMKRGAFISALSDKAQSSQIFVIDELNVEAPKTKEVNTILDKLGLAGKKCYILDQNENKNVALSFRNLSRIKYSQAPLANTYDIVNAEALLMTTAGLKKIEEVFA